MMYMPNNTFLNGKEYMANPHAAEVATASCPAIIPNDTAMVFQNIRKNSGLSNTTSIYDWREGIDGSNDH
jgi:hypothetical protein